MTMATFSMADGILDLRGVVVCVMIMVVFIAVTRPIITGGEYKDDKEKSYW